ncbi:S8 family serine peptidase [Streptomyces angustmyceticus]|uniref:S8 family serine peptidase n=1 Tax=Streptomyces angustmyceticus TaxID=285578 RepID=UPI003D93B30F
MSFTRTLRAVSGAVVVGALLFGAAPTAVADQIRNDQWPLKAFDAESIWKESTGRGVTVAVVDDPVNGSHQDLNGNVLTGKNFIDGGSGDRESSKNHGTGMASLIAGHGHGSGNAEGIMGLAPDAKIIPVGRPAVGAGVGNSGLGEWIRYAVDQDASVINLSISPSFLTDSDREALSYANGKDVLVVAGAGNDGENGLTPLAASPGVVAVGAVDKSGKPWVKSNSGIQLMLSAPGVEITSASASGSDPYHLADGTSDATAYVSAAAALLRSKFPDLSAGQIANRLVKSAGLPPGETGSALPDPHYGYGFIQPLKALTADIPAGSKNGPLKTPKAEPTPPASGDQADERADDGLGAGAMVGIAVGVLAVASIVVIVVVVSRKKDGRNGPPPGGPGGFGGPGGPGFAPQQLGPYHQAGSYPQQGVYQQPGTHQQYGAPGEYPAVPPVQPPGWQ